MKNKIGLKNHILLLLIVTLFVFSLNGCSKNNQSVKYPTQPINVICPWSAGGSTDLVARVASKALAEKWGAVINVINKPGGKGIPGTLEALTSKPDGYTILADADGSNAIVAAWGTDVPFDISERTYIAKVAEFPWLFIIRTDLAWKSLNDVAEAIKNNPENIKWGWLGGTAGADAPVVQFMAALEAKGIDTSKVKMVTYPGGSDLATAVAGGHVDIGVVSSTSVGPVYNAGKVKLIAITGKERFQSFPDVPTTVEQGWNTVTFRGHVGFAAPKGLSGDIVKIWERTTEEILKDPKVVEELAKIGAVPAFANSEDYRNYVLNLADELKALKK
ncbi:tripartite tricarboxylate transporter substrate binding protein [Thermovorax subterraneus]|nr:tripartite tricarboxylate transporter substrate binding protein [Thermovorax subterraneus]